MAPRYVSIFNIIYKNNFKKMTEGLVVGILLLGMLIWCFVKGFDDYNEFN